MAKKEEEADINLITVKLIKTNNLKPALNLKDKHTPKNLYFRTIFDKNRVFAEFLVLTLYVPNNCRAIAPDERVLVYNLCKHWKDTNFKCSREYRSTILRVQG